ncbi:hypothetical protein QFC24_005612 [Naganishia onofrii]|uniref:Uncharacterized protein n=1 Tax=Naganishia onofrii TaxID=1851511 RepID=A0ACC2XAS6_9TREE|nr:hypothetical protein QFC24_005612 [Naganishia onofrii]
MWSFCQFLEIYPNHRLQALVCAKGQLAVELAYNRPPPSTQAGAEALRSAIEAESDVHGLNSLIETLRKELTTLVTGLEALQQLKPRGSPEERRIQADVYRERMAKIREKNHLPTTKDANLANKRATTEGPDGNGWTRAIEIPMNALESVFIPLTDRNVTDKKNKVNEIIECRACGLQGLTDKDKENSHYKHACQGSEKHEKWRATNGYAQQVFFPIQLLWNAKWGLDLHKQVMDARHTEKWYIETIEVGNPPQLLFSALQLRKRDDEVLERDSQWMDEQNTMARTFVAYRTKGMEVGVQSSNTIFQKFAKAFDDRRT